MLSTNEHTFYFGNDLEFISIPSPREAEDKTSSKRFRAYPKIK
jgi:hypothetical protein